MRLKLGPIPKNSCTSGQSTQKGQKNNTVYDWLKLTKVQHPPATGQLLTVFLNAPKIEMGC